ncbi:MAG: HmuY family protein [Chitinophagaceae bacterium]
MKQKLKTGLMCVAAALTLAIGCRKKDAPLPDNQVQFESSEQGIAEASADITVKIKLSRAVDQTTPISISLTNTGVDYTADYTTEPAATSGNVIVNVLSGSNEATLKITKASGALFNGDEKIVLKIVSSGSPVVIGTTNEFTLKFAELVATAASIVGDGGGATYGNKVFFDLSANTQTGVQRTKWDLGFYTGTEFRVILNSSSAMMAKQIAKNDLNAVSAADTVGFSNDVIFNQAAPTTQSLAYIDYPDGDLTKTAIAEIAATGDDNKVYIINRGKGIGSPAPDRGWKKIRIIRNAGGGYTLQHADIAATSFTSVDISKDVAYNFKYISFESGAVDVEPAKDKWDFAWTYFSNVTNFGGGEVPYTFQDIILQNRNVQVAKVDTAGSSINWIEYENFTETDISKYTFSNNQTTIGSTWRVGGGPSSPPVMNTKRYYIIKDSDGNYYKVKFTALTQNGERGYPAFEYKLVKRGS